MAQLIADCHMVCLPTTYAEGIPRILIEAAAVGRSVIASDIAGCDEFIQMGDDGILIAPGNQRQLREAIERLAADRILRQQYGLNGRQKVEKYYSNNVVIKQTLGAYAAVLESVK